MAVSLARSLRLIALGAALVLASKAHAVGLGQHAAAATGASTTPPIGWVQFCRDNPADCRDRTYAATDLKLTQKAWADLVKINKKVNDAVEPMTDLDHYGVVEYWAYPTDGKGDCEDYVLEKRKQLMEMGYPRSALLITVVRQQNGEGHAILTVKTDRGDYILDNQVDEIVLWHQTPYRFVKRQAQDNQNQWVSIGTPAPAPAYTSK